MVVAPFFCVEIKWGIYFQGYQAGREWKENGDDGGCIIFSSIYLLFLRLIKKRLAWP
jgi:hypothetical protein